MNTIKHVLLWIVGSCFVNASHAMELSPDPYFARFLQQNLRHIKRTQYNNDTMLWIFHKYLEKMYISSKKEEKGVDIFYPDIDLSIDTTLIHHAENNEQHKKIRKALSPFYSMGRLIYEGHPGTQFIPILSTVIQHKFPSLPTTELQTALIELMIINTKILRTIPFEFLNTSSGVRLLNKTGFAKRFYQLCLFESALIARSSLDTVSFNNKTPQKYPKPFIELYTRISKKIKSNPTIGPIMEPTSFELDIASPPEVFETYKKTVFLANEILTPLKSSETSQCLQELEEFLKKKLEHIS